MMKAMTAILTVIAILFSTACAVSAPDGFYPRTATVIEFNYMTDAVICKDCAGIVWIFYGIEDWNIGDLVSMMLYDNGTPDSIYDDEIVMAYYGGWVD